VIQTAAGHGIQAVKSVLLVNNKNPNSVIHTTAHQAIQVRIIVLWSYQNFSPEAMLQY
jgi:hypothetical protein